MLPERGKGLGNRRFADTQGRGSGAYRPEPGHQNKHFQLGKGHRRGTVGERWRRLGVEITLRLGGD